jgi:hypothetical protein
MQVQSGMEENMRIVRWYGMYFYESVGDAISLYGQEENDSIILSEKVNGEKTGFFRGVFSDTRFEGAWTNEKTKKQLPFSLLRVTDFKTLTEIKDGWKIDYCYPKFVRENELARFINDSVTSSTEKYFYAMSEGFKANYEPGGMNFEANQRYAVNFVHDSLVSCLIERWDFTGGAHGNSYFEVMNAGYVTGSPKMLMLDKLFIPGSDYLRVLSAAGIEQLRLAEAPYVLDGSITELKDNLLLHFTLSPKGFRLHYAPYEVGPYAGGPLEITIPWKKLESIIDRNGPLAPVLPKKK